MPMAESELLPTKIIDGERQWVVQRCPRGCYHVCLDRVSLTLTMTELMALRDLLQRACARFPPPAPSAVTPTRTH